MSAAKKPAAAPEKTTVLLAAITLADRLRADAARHERYSQSEDAADELSGAAWHRGMAAAFRLAAEAITREVIVKTGALSGGEGSR